MAAQQQSELDVLASLMKLFSGEKTTTSGGSQTVTDSKQMTPEGLAAILKMALESNAGLANVAQGQRTAGLYGSSTNRLLTNDLLSRLTAQAAANTSSSTRTIQNAPQVVQRGGMGNMDSLTQLVAGYSALQKLGLTGQLSKAGKSVMDILGQYVPSGADQATNFPGVDAAAALDVGATTPLGLDLGTASAIPGEANLQMGGGITYTPSSAAYTEAPIVSQTQAPAQTAQYGDILSPSFGGFTEAQIGTAPAAGEFTVPTEEQYGNFPAAPSTSSNGSVSNTKTSATGQVGEGAYSASTIPQVSVAGLGSAAVGIYSGISALTDSSSQNDITGAANLATGSASAYQSYQTYQAAQQAKAAADAAAAAEGVEAASSASSASSFTSGFSAGSGSALGYVGPIMDALYAPRNPEGEHGKDYRRAVGGAILNYFGAGFATPYVDAIVRPALDWAQDQGEESLGVAGAVAADPVGAVISGEYNFGEVLTSGLDPANIWGGNPGGSPEKLIGALADPVGSALGVDWITKPVTDIAKQTSDVLESAWKAVTNPVKSVSKGCYITTACMQNQQAEFDDNCRELTVTRKLRDDYVAKIPGGDLLIEVYYKTAPDIVARISAREDSQKIWRNIYKQYILPAVEAYEAGDKSKSYEIYLDLVENADAISRSN